jgi:BCD family chlorophyll transporter-like MFS transporter
MDQTTLYALETREGILMFLKRIQLGLLHVAVAMTLVPINSTLNRIMIKELGISAALVAVLASLPYLFSPVQVAIGSFADRHPLLGYRRSPYIFLGLILCVLGVAVSPTAAYLMADGAWTGWLIGLLAFGLWGMGYNLATVSYLSLATEISGERGRGKTISIMFFMMIVAIIATSISLSRMLETYSPETLARAFYTVGTAALLLGVLGLLFLEERGSRKAVIGSDRAPFRTLIAAVTENPQAKLFFVYLTILLAALLGQDVLLEPFGAEAFNMTVEQTTRITSIWGGTFLLALLVAGLLEGRASKRTVARVGGAVALLGFALIAGSGAAGSRSLFYTGLVLLGMGTGLSTVSNLSLMLDMTTSGNVGLYIGAWGMANAFSRLIGSVLGGVVRDVVSRLSQTPVSGYIVVFAIEALFILVSLSLLSRIDVNVFRKRAEEKSLLEVAALANDGS